MAKVGASLTQREGRDVKGRDKDVLQMGEGIWRGQARDQDLYSALAGPCGGQDSPEQAYIG